MRRFMIAPLAFAAILGVSTLAPAFADDSGWERIDKGGVKSGSVAAGIGDLLAVACPASTPQAQPRLIVRILALQNGYYDGKTQYNLRLVINDYRQDFAMAAKDGTFVFEAADFNQRLQLQDFVQHMIAAAAAGVDQMQLAFSSLGWRGQMPLAGADKVLDGVLDGCGQ